MPRAQQLKVARRILRQVYSTLKFWFFDILKSHNSALVSIVLRKQPIVFFVEIKQKSMINSSQLYLKTGNVQNYEEKLLLKFQGSNSLRFSV